MASVENVLAGISKNVTGLIEVNKRLKKRITSLETDRDELRQDVRELREEMQALRDKLTHAQFPQA